MKKRIGYFVLICLLARLVQAEERLEIRGYFESQLMGTVIKQKSYVLSSNKLRVDLNSDVTENVIFAANFDYITYHGKTEWEILDFLPAEIKKSVPAELQPVYVLPFSEQNFLDNAFLKLIYPGFDLTIGKQQISPGTGYAWNPIDIFNIKDLLDPTYEQPGHNAVRLDLPLGLANSVTALYAPDDSWQNSTKMLQFKGRISHFDYSLIAIEKVWRFHDYRQFLPGSAGFLELPETRQLFGASTAGELLGLGVWAEYAHNRMDISRDFYELVTGINYTFDFQTYFMLEFYRNTLAKTEYHDYTLNDWMRLLTNEQKAIARDQLYLFVQHPLTDFIDLSLSSIYCLTDGSIALVPTLNYSLAQNTELMAYLNLNIGKAGTAFSENSGNGGMIRARIYF